MLQSKIIATQSKNIENEIFAFGSNFYTLYLKIIRLSDIKI